MNCKTMIVDDSLTIRKIIKANLEKLEIKDVLEAGDGESALRTLAANPGVSLIFIDYNMPIMNGLSAIKKMREDSSYDHIKVVVVSSSFDPTLIANFEKLNVAGFIVKPFDLQKFNNTLRPILDAPAPSADAPAAQGVPKDDVVRLFSGEKPEVGLNGRFVEFDFKNEKIKLEVDVISRFGSVYVELGQ
jgi:CheY-like chemotaxis protein